MVATVGKYVKNKRHSDKRITNMLGEKFFFHFFLVNICSIQDQTNYTETKDTKTS